MNALTQELVELLTLEKLEENIYRGISRNLVGKRVFGGQVLGQALRAASYTTDRPAHSLHAYFLYGGDINAPIIYEVDRLRDGKSFVSRQVRVVAIDCCCLPSLSTARSSAAYRGTSQTSRVTREW